MVCGSFFALILNVERCWNATVWLFGMCVICVLINDYPMSWKQTNRTNLIYNVLWIDLCDAIYATEWIDMSWKIDAYNVIRSNWSLSNDFDLNICWCCSCCLLLLLLILFFFESFFWNSNMQCDIYATRSQNVYISVTVIQCFMCQLSIWMDWLSLLFEQRMRSIKQILNVWRQTISFNWNEWRLAMWTILLWNFKYLFLSLLFCVCVSVNLSNSFWIIKCTCKGTRCAMQLDTRNELGFFFGLFVIPSVACVTQIDIR